MKLGKKNRIWAGFAAFLFAGMANAIPVTWTLNNVVFDDGGTASGTFVYDADTNIYSGVNVNTTTGSVLPGNEYLGCGIFPGCNNMAATQTLFWPEIQDNEGPVFELQFDTALTNAGGVIGLTENSDLSSCGYTWGASNEFGGVGSDCRYLVSGTVSAVPVTAAAWLFGSALVGLSWIRRKQSA